jgi:hypothetical protein
MTEKNFKQALRRGLGSAIIELKNNENRIKYRDIIKYYCLRDISYDWQSEGTKGFYLYFAICALGEQDYFEQIIIEKFLSRCQNKLFFQLTDILLSYIYDGSQSAEIALYKKYKYFLAKKGKLTKSFALNIDEGSQWEYIALDLVDFIGFPAFKRYVAELGNILLKNPNKSNRLYYDWFISSAENKFGKEKIKDFFDNEYNKSDAIKALVDTLKAEELSQEQREMKKVDLKIVLEAAKESVLAEYPQSKMVKFRRYFMKNAAEIEIMELANAVICEKDESVKASLLVMFRDMPFPLGITPLIEYAQSNNKYLSEVAIKCLEEIKDKRIHDLSMQLLKTKRLDSFALDLLRKNYKKSDDDVIYALLKKSTSIPHHVQMDIGSIYRRHRSANALSNLLIVYRKGECSFCRNRIIEAMNHSGVLSNEILEECLYDSYDDTRKFAKRLIKKRKGKNI